MMPARSKLGWWVATLSLVSGLASANAPQALNEGASGPSGCITWATHTIFSGAGYDHSITFKSKCQAPMVCAVKPSIGGPLQATVAPGKTESLLIWRGSPASVVSAEVQCQPQ